MATRKITITLEVEQVEEVQRLVATKRVSSVSGFVQHAVGIALLDANGWAAMLAQALDDTGGPPTRRERAWADQVLSGRVPRRALPRTAA